MVSEEVVRVRDQIEAWLKGIRGITCFSEKMKIYAPTCYNPRTKGHECLPEVEKLIERVNKIFGGSTVYDAEGSWIDEETGELVVEPVKVIEVGHECADLKDAQELADAIVEYATKAGQKSIAIHQGSFFIAETPKLQKAYEKLLKIKQKTLEEFIKR
jgi:hypothetical protein